MSKALNNRGFTLLEVVVVLGISLLLAGGITELLLVSLRGRDVAWGRLSIQNTGRKTVQNFVNEIRAVSYSSIGAYPIEKATATEIVFYTNLDSDSWRERVRYYFDGTSLKKGVTKPSVSPVSYDISKETISIVAENIQIDQSAFYYYDSSYSGNGETALAWPVSIPQIKVVRIVLVIADSQGNVVPLEITAHATIRNLSQL